MLVVEDEHKLRDLVRAYLEHEDLVVYSTGSGAEALQVGRRSPLDLVVLDLSLPDVPGEEVARELRAGSDVPIIMLTAKSPHNFMNDKILVTDNVLITGSYNFSANAEKNAENQLHVSSDQGLVDKYTEYISAISNAYA